MLEHGAKGQDVVLLQKMLNARGAALLVDGVYGDATEHAVRQYQQRAGLVADGRAGSKTRSHLAGNNTSQLLQDSAIYSAAERLGVSPAAVYAVNEVESAGSGFFTNGKIKILFERHIMYQRLRHGRSPTDDSAALAQRAEQLATQYPQLVNAQAGGYVGGEAEHQRLSQARQLDELAALESASWGAFQIMGYHAERLGYPSVNDFVSRMQSNETEQFEAFVRFIEADPALHKALKQRKWADFARRYNGPGYARNLYDSKLQRAYERYSAALEPA